MGRPRKDGTAPKTTKATKVAKENVADVEKSVETAEVVEPIVDNTVETEEKVEDVCADVQEVQAETEVEEIADVTEVVTEEAPVAETVATETPTEEIPVADASTEKPVTAPEKKEDIQKASKKKKVSINGIIALSGPTAIYRGPGVYPFAKINGVVKPLGDADESGYTKVQCVISGSGVCTGYVKL